MVTVNNVRVGDELYYWDRDLMKRVRCIVIAITPKRIRIRYLGGLKKLVNPDTLKTPAEIGKANIG